MSALTRTPQNTNYLQPTKFLMTFNRIPDTTWFCQSVNVPGVSVGQAPINFPSVMVYSPGNQISYNNFNMNFLVNENLTSWIQLHDWFRSFASPDGTDERNLKSQLQNQYNTPSNQNNSKGYYSDATLTILSALNNPIVRVEFTNMFPVSLSDIFFDTKQSADDMITADATFVYDQFKFIPV
jgi:hypothetical protein